MSHLQSRFSVPLALLVSVFSLLAFAVPQAHAAGLTCTWTGVATAPGEQLLFSDEANWSDTDCGVGVVPGNDDVIRFTNLNVTGSNQTSGGGFLLENDLAPGTAFAGVILSDSGDPNSAGSSPTSTSYGVDVLQLQDGAFIRTVRDKTDVTEFPAFLFVGDFNSSTGVIQATGTLLADGSLTLQSLGTEGEYAVRLNAMAASVTMAGELTADSGSVTSVSPSDITGVTRYNVLKGANLRFVGDDTVSGSKDISTPMTFGGGSGSVAPLVTFDDQANPVPSTFANAWNITGAIQVDNPTEIEIVQTGDTADFTTATIAPADYSITESSTSNGTLLLPAVPDPCVTGCMGSDPDATSTDDVPTVPNTGFQLLMANPAMTLLGTAMTTTGLLAIRKKFRF